MRRTIFIPLVVILLLFPVGKAEGGDPSVSSIEMDPEPLIEIPGADYPQQDGGSDDRLFQYRSMWLEGYQIINHSEVQKVVQMARDSNINCLTPLINAHYLGTFYNSSYHPRYRDLEWDFDPTMDLIREAHKYNIKVMPWFHTMIDRFAIRDHPEWAQVSSGGSRSTAWLNPTLPEVQQYLADVVYQLFRDYPLDGIHLDACRYPSSSYGYDDYSIQQYYDEGWDDFNAFRRQQMTEVMTAIYDSISSIRPYVWIGADIGAGLGTRQNSWFQDTEKWASMGIIDFVTPMIYTLNSASLESTLRDNINRHSCPVVCGNYVYVPEDSSYGTVPDEATGISKLLNQTERAINSGALGTCFFAYKFMADHPNYHKALREGVFSEKALCPLKKQTRPVRDLDWEFELDQDREGWRTTKMGNYYPYEGVWSIIGVTEPTFMSPLLNVSASDINIIELSMKAENTAGNITIYWSHSKTEMVGYRSLTFKLVDTGDWNLYSIHIDRSMFWTNIIRYIWIVPEFTEPTNITIDLIRMTWMPDCITTWGYLGPFFTGDSEDLLDREFIENERDILPRIGDTAGGREWRLFSMDRDQVDLRFVLGHVRDAVTYSHVYIRSPFEGIVEMRHGNSDGARIWLNGEEVFYHDSVRSVYPDQNITYVVLNEGINTLMIKQVVYVDDNSFFMRFTAPGNATLEGLEYYPELPPMGPPMNLVPDGVWISSSDVLVQWDPPMNETGLDHYQWTLNEGEPHVSESGAVLINGLKDGTHEFKVLCIDDLGFSGEDAAGTILVDTRLPVISTPIPLETVSIDQNIKWYWNVEFEPISSIDHFLVTIENWKQGTSDVYYSVIEEEVNDTEYILKDNIKDGYRYRIIVKAVSGSGLVHAASSEVDVLVDLTVPLRPTGVSLELIGHGSRDYRLSWIESVDNTYGGIEHYEIWWSVEGDEWTMFGTTEDLSISVRRPLGRSIGVKVRSVDVSSHYSDFSDIVRTENMPPEPEILILSELVEGAPILLSTPITIDPDGTIIRYSWYIDGRFISDQREISITFLEGRYTATLWTTDDQLVTEKATRTIEIDPSNGPISGTSLKRWLETTSEDLIVMPDVNITHYDNRTIHIQDNDTTDEGPMMKDILTDMLLVVVGVPLIFIILLAILFLTIGEIFDRKGNSEDEESVVRTKKIPSVEKEILQNKIVSDPNFQRAFSFQQPKRSLGPWNVGNQVTGHGNEPAITGVRRDQNARSASQQVSRGSGPLIPEGFRSAPSLGDIEEINKEKIEVKWDEDDDDEIEEWEEVEA